MHAPIVSLAQKSCYLGYLGGSVSSASDLGSGHDLMVCELEPQVWLCADSSEPDAGLQLINRTVTHEPNHEIMT